MNPDAYTLAAQAEERHWWFCGRRSVLRAILDHFLSEPSKARDILEIGCGNGGNLALLSTYGNLFAVELDDAARKRAVARGLAKVEEGQLPRALPFPGKRFDIIAALDVLEHVPDDEDSVRALGERLKPGGLLLLTVPAYQWLWGHHDEVSHRVRRYSRTMLQLLLERNGFTVKYCGYFNTLLFPFAVAQIKLAPIIHTDRFDAIRIPPRLLNRTLQAVFSLERLLVPRFSLPYGLSLIAVAQANQS